MQNVVCRLCGLIRVSSRIPHTNLYSGTFIASRYNSSSLESAQETSDSCQNESRRQKYDHAYMNRDIGTTKAHQRRLLRQKPDQTPDARLLKVAIIGAPNAGKSTLANKLLGWNVAAISQKVHTTRQRTLGVFCEGDTQVVILDTPGMITPSKRKKHKLDKSLLTDPHATLYEADLIAVVVDISKIWNRSKLDTEVLKALHLHPNKPSVLLLNKVDDLKNKYLLLEATRTLTCGLVDGQRDSFRVSESLKNSTTVEHMFEKMRQKHKHLLQEDLGENNDITRSSDTEIFKDTDFTESDSQKDEGMSKIIDKKSKVWDGISRPDLSDSQVWNEYHTRLRWLSRVVEGQRGWPHFSKVFMLSALEGDGVHDIKDYMLSHARPMFWMYHSSVVTDNDPQELAKMAVWSKLLEHLPDEIPYNVMVKQSMWHVDENDTLHAAFDLICYRKREMFWCLGKGGTTCRKMALEAKQELMNVFRREMTLRLVVRLRDKNR